MIASNVAGISVLVPSQGVQLHKTINIQHGICGSKPNEEYIEFEWEKCAKGANACAHIRADQN